MGEPGEPCAQSLPKIEYKVPPCWWGPATGPPTNRCGHGIRWMSIHGFAVMPLWHCEEVASHPTSLLRLPIVSLANLHFNHNPKPMQCFIFILLFSFPLTSPCLAVMLHAMIISLNLYVHTLHHMFTLITFGQHCFDGVIVCLPNQIKSFHCCSFALSTILRSSLYFKESSICLLFDYNPMCFLLLFH